MTPQDTDDHRWHAVAAATKGFLPEQEAWALHAAGVTAARSGLGPLLEVGAYCGRSTLFLGAAARDGGEVLFSLDHHRGSEENQAGWEHHDPSLVDAATGRMDTLPHWRRAVERGGLEAVVVGLVGESSTVARRWRAPLSLVFIDGGHGEDVAWADYDGWSPWVAIGGLLAIHDVFPDPADGGRPPFELYQAACASGEFEVVGEEGSLRVLRRVDRHAVGIDRHAVGIARTGGASQP